MRNCRAAEDSPDQLLDLHARACEQSRRILAGTTSLGTLVAREPFQDERFNVRCVLIHMIEEYARHAGHADLIREEHRRDCRRLRPWSHWTR
ncbi:MAG: DinB family protein, partial [Brevibacterium sp.]|nr:DinB family protein [Brevibacterium sp.]